MMETIWSKDGTIEQGNQEARNMIAAEEATCQEFPISCQERDGVWGIWFGLGEIVILFNPIDLVNSSYKDDTYYLLDIYVEEGEKKPESIPEIEKAEIIPPEGWEPEAVGENPMLDEIFDEEEKKALEELEDERREAAQQEDSSMCARHDQHH